MVVKHQLREEGFTEAASNAKSGCCAWTARALKSNAKTMRFMGPVYDFVADRQRREMWGMETTAWFAGVREENRGVQAGAFVRDLVAAVTFHRMLACITKCPL